MSNKNLKVYKMHFITEVRKLTMNVKFACKMKMSWKRSNECSESTWVSLQGGSANFDQTLKLKVSMYFDTTANKFVEKKCLYSFLISTEKGEKSAGTITIDLAEFFNKRVYEMQKDFPIEKCPVAGTKIEMKIYYEEEATEQAGYDSMSCISSTNQMDSSVASVDLGDLAPTRSNVSQKEEQTEKSSDLSSSKVELEKEKEEQKYLNLEASDVIEYPTMKPLQPSDGTKIGENIKNINTLTTKINQFVTDKSKDIRYEIEGFKRKISALEEQVQSEKIAREKIEGQLAEQKKKNGDLQKQYNDFKVDIEHKMEVETKKNQELQGKLKTSQDLLTQMESKISQSGESQSAYIQQLKSNHETSQIKFNQELEEMRENIVHQKKAKNEFKEQVGQLEASLKDIRERFQNAVHRNETMENDMRRKEEEIETTRINLQKAFEHLVTSLNAVI